MINIKGWLSFIGIIILGSGFLKTCIDKNKYENMYDSQVQINEYYKKNKNTLQLDKKAFQTLLNSVLDSSTKIILKSNGIKEKRITTYINTSSNVELRKKIYYKDSSVVINDTIINHLLISRVDSPFYKINSEINLDNKIGNIKVEIPDTIQVFIYESKRTKSFLGLFRYGKRELKDTLINKNPYVKFKKNLTIVKN